MKVIQATFSKGNHRYHGFLFDWLCNLFPVKIKRQGVKLQFMLHESCWYLDPQDPGQINKLFGFSSWLIHKDSYRIGWKPNPYHEPFEKSFILYSYVYQDGKRYEQVLKTVTANTWHTIHIYPYELPKGPVWKCFPYIGGKLPAQNDCLINIQYE